MDGPLTGIRILDCSRLMPFSYGTQLLAEAGATVVKVEAVGGEYGRGMPEVFALTNRGKRSITLNLRTQRGRELLMELAVRYDAILESFRPGFLVSLGLGYEDLRKVAPRLVYCSATGYGQTGPLATRPGHDLNYAALGGLLAPDGGDPVVAPVPFIDMIAGWAVAYAIATGVLAARATGHGRHLDVGMSDLALSLNTLAVAYRDRPQAVSGGGPLDGYPWPDLMREGCPCYGVFSTRDGRRIALANVEPKFWEAFLDVIDRPDLSGDRFSTGARARQVRGEIGSILAAKDLDEWASAFADRDICWAPVHDVLGALLDPQYQARATAVRTHDGGWHLRLPVVGGRVDVPNVVPAAGEHTEEILEELGYNRGDVDAWRREGVL